MRITDINETASAGASSAGAIATSMGGGNGFLNGGPGTVKRAGVEVAGLQTSRKRRRKSVSEGHMDHEVRMAHGELLNLAHNAAELYKMVKGVGESEGLPGWVSAYITLANDYMESVTQYMREGAIEQATDTNHRF